MNNTFTLSEFVFFARAFVINEEVLMRNVREGQDGRQQLLVGIIDRLELLEKQFEERRVHYLSDLAIQHSLLEQSLKQKAVVTAGKAKGDSNDHLALIRKSFDNASAVTNQQIDLLQGLVAAVKLAAFNKF